MPTSILASISFQFVKSVSKQINIINLKTELLCIFFLISISYLNGCITDIQFVSKYRNQFMMQVVTWCKHEIHRNIFFISTFYLKVKM